MRRVGNIDSTKAGLRALVAMSWCAVMLACAAIPAPASPVEASEPPVHSEPVGEFPPLRSSEGDVFFLSDYVQVQGAPAPIHSTDVVFVFGAPWCEACKEATHFIAHAGILPVYVNLSDVAGDGGAPGSGVDIAGLRSELPTDALLLLRGDTHLARQWSGVSSVDVLPVCVFIARDGRVAGALEGFNEAAFDAALTELTGGQ